MNKKQALEAANEAQTEKLECGCAATKIQGKEGGFSFKYYDAQGFRHYLNFEFTTLKEYEVGTAGMDSRGQVWQFMSVAGERYMVTEYKLGEEGAGMFSKTFTPIVQNDPVLVKAYELMSEAIHTMRERCCDEPHELRDTYMDLAKTELRNVV